MLSEFRPRIWPWAKVLLAQCTGFYTFTHFITQFVLCGTPPELNSGRYQARSTAISPQMTSLFLFSLHVQYSISAHTSALPSLDGGKRKGGRHDLWLSLPNSLARQGLLSCGLLSLRLIFLISYRAVYVCA